MREQHRKAVLSRDALSRLSKGGAEWQKTGQSCNALSKSFCATLIVILACQGTPTGLVGFRSCINQFVHDIPKDWLSPYLELNSYFPLKRRERYLSNDRRRFSYGAPTTYGFCRIHKTKTVQKLIMTLRNLRAVKIYSAVSGIPRFVVAFKRGATQCFSAEVHRNHQYSSGVHTVVPQEVTEMLSMIKIFSVKEVWMHGINWMHTALLQSFHSYYYSTTEFERRYFHIKLVIECCFGISELNYCAEVPWIFHAGVVKATGPVTENCFKRRISVNMLWIVYFIWIAGHIGI